jgi:uncharacterized protein YggE
LSVTNESVADAIKGVAALADATTTAVRELGVDDSDVSTQNVHVQDRFDPQQQRVTARVAIYTFTIAVRNLREVASVVARLATTAGDALTIQGIGFSHSDPASLLAVARRDAVADARSRAEQLADAADMRMGRILGIDESSSASAGRGIAALRSGAPEFSGPAMPINPGSQSVTARVIVTYALDESRP